MQQAKGRLTHQQRGQRATDHQPPRGGLERHDAEHAGQRWHENAGSDQHQAQLRALRCESGRPLPEYVEQEFEAYLKCGRLEHGFLRVRCGECHAEKLVAFSCKRRGFCPSCGARRMAETAALLVEEVLPVRTLRHWVLSLPHALRFQLATNPAALTPVLGEVWRTISGFLLQRVGLTRATGATGVVTLVQRVGSALNLNIHFHMLFVDGVYLPAAAGPPVFRHLPAPTGAQLQVVVQQIAERVGHVLERCGLVERDMENAWLAGDGEAGPLDDLIGPSIDYRIAVGPRAGQKLFTLQTVPACDEAGDQQGEHRGVGAAKYPPADPAKPATPHHVAMNWARRLKRVFGIEIEACARCGVQLRIIVSIEEPEVIKKIPAHLERVAPEQYSAEWRDSASRRQPWPAHQAHYANRIGQGRRSESTIRRSYARNSCLRAERTVLTRSRDRRASFQLVTWMPIKTPTITISRSIQTAVQFCFSRCLVRRRSSMASPDEIVQLARCAYRLRRNRYGPAKCRHDRGRPVGAAVPSRDHCR